MAAGKRTTDEVALFMDKILVFYTAEETNALCCLLVPKQEICRVDPKRYLFYTDWYPLFDIVPSLSENKIRMRLVSIFNDAIKRTVLTGLRYRISAFEKQRKAAAKSIRRKAIQLMKRYYKGVFLTTRFRSALIRLINSISSKLSVSLREEIDYPQLVSIEYVN